MPPYRYDAYRSPYSASIGELLSRRGDIAARAAEARGQAWGTAAQQIGATVGGTIQQATDPRRQLETLQLGETKRAIQSRTALGQIIGSTPHVDEEGVSLYDIPAISKKLEAAGHGDHVGDVATQLKGVNDAFRMERQAKLATVQRGAMALLQGGADPELTLNFLDVLDKNHSWPKAQVDLVRQVIQKDPTKVPAILRQFAGPEKIGTAAPGTTLYGETTGAMGPTVPTDPDKGAYTIHGQRFRADGTPVGAVQPQQPLQVAPATAQTHNMRLKGVGDVPVDYVPNKDGTGGRWFYQGKDVTGTVAVIPAASIQINQAAQGDLIDQAQQLVDGNLPPAMLSKRSASYNAILADANRLSKEQTGKAVNIGKLQLDYQAALKWVSSANAPPMFRFKGLAISVVNTIDEVKRLGDELKQGSIQKWNSVRRTTVQQFYGNTPQSELANRYVVAVNTLKEEFANLANGGYAPTEDAWKLANDQINTNFGFKDLTANLSEIQRLINYRLHAFEQVTPMLVGGQTPVPAAAAAAGGGPKEGDTKPIEGHPGTEQTFTGGKWIRTK